MIESDEIKEAVKCFGGSRCPHCGWAIRVPKNDALGVIICEHCFAEVSVTSEQIEEIRARNEAAKRETAARSALLSVVPRYPVCACGGPLILLEQAGRKPQAGHLFCAKCGPSGHALYRANAAEIQQAQAAARAEGFVVPPDGAAA